MKKLSSRFNSAIAIGAFAMMALLSGCEYDYVEPDNTPPPTTISFATDILPIFNAGCNGSGCHATGAFAPDLSPANAYNSLMQNNRINTADPATSPFYIKISTGSMKTFLSTNDAKLILAWIEKGALNN